MASRDFKRLKVWTSSHELTLAVYQATASFPRDEMYGLTSQIRRSGASVAANIAEGCGRGGDAELARFLAISMGSASELEYHLILARDLGFLTRQTYTALADEVVNVKRMLTSFIKYLRGKTKTET